jgi:hypothetical protein
VGEGEGGNERGREGACPTRVITMLPACAYSSGPEKKACAHQSTDTNLLPLPPLPLPPPPAPPHPKMGGEGGNDVKGGTEPRMRPGHALDY